MFVFSGVLSQCSCVSGATQAIKNLDDKTVASFDALLDAFSLVPWSSAGGAADSRSTSLETIDYEEGEMETPKKKLEPGPSVLDMVGDHKSEIEADPKKGTKSLQSLEEKVLQDATQLIQVAKKL